MIEPQPVPGYEVNARVVVVIAAIDRDLAEVGYRV